MMQKQNYWLTRWLVAFKLLCSTRIETPSWKGQSHTELHKVIEELCRTLEELLVSCRFHITSSNDQPRSLAYQQDKHNLLYWSRLIESIPSTTQRLHLLLNQYRLLLIYLSPIQIRKGNGRHVHHHHGVSILSYPHSGHQCCRFWPTLHLGYSCRLLEHPRWRDRFQLWQNHRHYSNNYNQVIIIKAGIILWQISYLTVPIFNHFLIDANIADIDMYENYLYMHTIEGARL